MQKAAQIPGPWFLIQVHLNWDSNCSILGALRPEIREGMDVCKTLQLKHTFSEMGGECISSTAPYLHSPLPPVGIPHQIWVFQLSTAHGLGKEYRIRNPVELVLAPGLLQMTLWPGTSPQVASSVKWEPVQSLRALLLQHAVSPRIKYEQEWVRWVHQTKGSGH